jgi:trk system potassium uptake protein TrkA
MGARRADLVDARPRGLGHGGAIVPAMYVLIVGCGRVGSAIAKSMLAEGHEVSVLDENPEAIALLNRHQPESWEDLGGSFTVGTALEIDALLSAGIESADAFVASTNGDNTNLVIAQVAQRRFAIDRVVVRVLDPGRAKWYAQQGLKTVCPTQTAIELLEAAVRGEAVGSA